MAAKENEELQVLNDRFSEYIGKIKNQMSNQQGPELISIQETMEKFKELEHKMVQEKDKTKELEIYKKKFEAEQEKRKDAETKINGLTADKINAELDCEFQKKCNGLLQMEIQFLKEIYEEMIRKLHTEMQNITVADGDKLYKEMQEIRGQKTRITLDEQKEKMADMEKQFKKMMENLTGYEEAVNKKLDLHEEIENYKELLDLMKERVDLEEDHS